MKVRFQADVDLNQIIISAIVRREPTIDFQTALVAGLNSLHDREVLARTSHEKRVLVTHDHRTMPQHFGEFLATDVSSGVVIIPQHLSVVAAVEDLLIIWSTTELEEWINRICYFPL